MKLLHWNITIDSDGVTVWRTPTTKKINSPTMREFKKRLNNYFNIRNRQAYNEVCINCYKEWRCLIDCEKVNNDLDDYLKRRG